MPEQARHSRIIEVGAGIGEVMDPGESQLRSVRPTRIEDYPYVPVAYLEVARSYSNPLLVGPPICDELVALVQHMFTEEEVALVQHIRSPAGQTAAAVAKAAQRSIDQVRPILERLVDGKGILSSYGTGARKRYGLLPLVPGVFELVLVRTSLDTLTDWHRRFAELFEALYDTGYFVAYVERPLSAVRFLPVKRSIETHPMALPSDRLEKVLDRFKTFAVGLCQCRMAERLVGRGCDKPLENCVGYGDIVERFVRTGRMRRVTKRDVLEIKAEAEAAGLATFSVDIPLGKHTSGASCSCCGCCCYGLRTISEFNAPGMIAPPRFRPQVDATRCVRCARCAEACPTGAIAVDVRAKTYQYRPERCIGCGLCAVACGSRRALRMEPSSTYREPPRNLFSILLRTMPNYLRNAWTVWKRYP